MTQFRNCGGNRNSGVSSRMLMFQSLSRKPMTTPRFRGATSVDLTRDNRGVRVSSRNMPPDIRPFDDLKTLYVETCVRALGCHHDAQEAQRQVARIRELQRKLHTQKGESAKVNAAALDAAIEEKEAEAKRLEVDRVRNNAVAETVRAEMWAAIRLVGLAGEVGT